MNKKQQKSGFIQMILIIVGALVILRYVYNIDVIGFLTTGMFREWLDKVYAWGQIGWLKYKDIIITVWNFVLNQIKNFVSKF